MSQHRPQHTVTLLVLAFFASVSAWPLTTFVSTAARPTAAAISPPLADIDVHSTSPPTVFGVSFPATTAQRWTQAGHCHSDCLNAVSAREHVLFYRRCASSPWNEDVWSPNGTLRCLCTNPALIPKLDACLDLCYTRQPGASHMTPICESLVSSKSHGESLVRSFIWHLIDMIGSWGMTGKVVVALYAIVVITSFVSEPRRS
ncbi:hypothetical protein BKA62DRAFT_184299 [Auriculariales sp. MPI-PUGE-AT-0066]|nr:hypothetical protein BKA62DRAFT_184299 [Auriculariales sp. MPI-PUGE-AT-0066]